MAVSSTTKMVNLLTLVLVMLPGLSLSFSNSKLLTLLCGSYVCCNNPPTVPPYPRPRFPHRGLFLSIAKRDDRAAPFRRTAMEPGQSLWSTAGSGREADGRFPLRDADTVAAVAAAARGKDSLLMDILRMLRSSGPHRPRDLEDSAAYVGKRGHDDDRLFAGKRTFGELGGPNIDWEE